MASYMHDASSSGFLGDDLPVAADFVANFDSAGTIETAVQAALLHGNESLKSQLEAHERWKDYAEYIEILWEDGEFSYDIDGPPGVAEEIYRLEYGDGEATPPTAMLRKHAFRLGNQTSKAVEDELNTALGLTDSSNKAAEALYGG